MKYKRGQHPKSLANLKGRPKGAKNKFTTLKQAFLNAFVEMGGEAELTDWAKKNPKDFYQMVKVMLPRQIDVGVTLEDVIGALPPKLGDAVREQLVKSLSDRRD
jgi:hypothetical protein